MDTILYRWGGIITENKRVQSAIVIQRTYRKHRIRKNEWRKHIIKNYNIYFTEKDNIEEELLEENKYWQDMREQIKELSKNKNGWIITPD